MSPDNFFRIMDYLYVAPVIALSIFAPIFALFLVIIIGSAPLYLAAIWAIAAVLFLSPKLRPLCLKIALSNLVIHFVYFLATMVTEEPGYIPILCWAAILLLFGYCLFLVLKPKYKHKLRATLPK